MSDSPGGHGHISRTARKRLPGGLRVKLLDNALEKNLDTNGVIEAYPKHDIPKPNDVHDEGISLGTRPGVSAEQECPSVQEAQLQAKDASLQEALKEVAKLKSCNNTLEAAISETRKHCYDAEEKARKKSQDLTTAKRALIDNNAHINNLERQNSQLKTMLADTMDDLDQKHDELIVSKTRHANCLKEGKKYWRIYAELGAGLFYQMTRLEVMVANGCGRFFFEDQDLELKTRASRYLPLDEASRTMQFELAEFLMENNANGDLPVDKETAKGGLRLAIGAPPVIDQTSESSSCRTSEIEEVSQQKTRAVGDWKYLESMTPEMLAQESNTRSESEESLLSLVARSNSEAGCPDSATSNEPEQGSSMCEDSGVESIHEPKVEGSSNAEGRGLRWLLGYNPYPEEPFYPQYLRGGSTNDSSYAQSIHGVLSADSPITEGPGLESPLGSNAPPEEPHYPQLSQHTSEEKDANSTKSTEFAGNGNLTPLMASAPGLEEWVDSQEPQSPSGVKLGPLSTCNKPAAGPDLAWLLGYNPEPEEAFYPQYSQHHEHVGDSTSDASIEQDHEQTCATVPGIAPLFEVKPENDATATTAANSEPLAVDVSFADTSKDFKEEIIMRTRHEDVAFTDSTEQEQEETSSKTCEAAPIFTAQVENPPLAATSPTPEDLPVDMTFGDTSQTFKAGGKVRMTRGQRREAAIKKAQAEAIANKQKMDDRVVDDEGGSYGKKQSRQERRAAERKALKAVVRQPKRNVLRL